MFVELSQRVTGGINGYLGLKLLEQLFSGVFRLIEQEGKRDKRFIFREISSVTVDTGEGATFQGDRFVLLQEGGEWFEAAKDLDKGGGTDPVLPG